MNVPPALYCELFLKNSCALTSRTRPSPPLRGHTATRQTAVARMHAAEVKKITLDAHQLHGGMGYVVDTGLHLFSERARILSTFGGGRRYRREMA